MANGQQNYRTGQVGEYLVCSELARQGLIATPFAGNVPIFDVLVTDSNCKTVPIQVKTIRQGTGKSVTYAIGWTSIKNPRQVVKNSLVPSISKIQT
jgi:hypothetical protein